MSMRTPINQRIVRPSFFEELDKITMDFFKQADDFIQNYKEKKEVKSDEETVAMDSLTSDRKG